MEVHELHHKESRKSCQVLVFWFVYASIFTDFTTQQTSNTKLKKQSFTWAVSKLLAETEYKKVYKAIDLINRGRVIVVKEILIPDDSSYALEDKAELVRFFINNGTNFPDLCFCSWMRLKKRYGRPLH